MLPSEGSLSTEDTTELENKLGKEVESLGALARAMDEDVSATGRMLKGKEALANVVNLVAGRCGELVGRLGSVAQALIGGGAAMTAFAAGAAVLGGVVLMFDRIAESARKAEIAIQRMMEARRQATGEADTLQGRAAAFMEGAGIYGRAEAGRKFAEAAAKRGIPEDVALFGATAMQLSGLSGAQAEQAMGGWLAAGRPGFGKTTEDNRELVRRLLQIPPEQAEAALAGKRADVGIARAGEAPGLPTERSDQVIASVIRQMKQTGRYTAKELEMVERLARNEPAANIIPWWRTFGDIPGQALPISPLASLGERSAAAMGATAFDASHTLGELWRQFQVTEESVRGAAPPPPQTPVTINVGTFNNFGDRRRLLTVDTPRVGMGEHSHRSPE